MFRADLLLLLAAAVWGGAFVAQRAAMQHVGPLTFNGLRFALGTLVLLPVLYTRRSTAGGVGNRRLPVRKRSPLPASLACPGHPAPDGNPLPAHESSSGPAHGSQSSGTQPDSNLAAAPGRAVDRAGPRRAVLLGGTLAGAVLLAGVSLQQMGLVYTTAGKAGFITGLYVVLVPVFGLLVRQRVGLTTWLGVGLATLGLYFLSTTETFEVNRGDWLVLACAVVWAVHVLIIGWLSPQTDPVQLAVVQFALVAVLSLAMAAFSESIRAAGIRGAAWPLLYGGVLSVGVAYTLQVVGQRVAPPAHAGIVLSFEAVFAALTGWWLLGETLGARELSGCALMLIGILVSQVRRPLPAGTVAEPGPAG